MKVGFASSGAKSLALVYLARGAEADRLLRFDRFLQSYRRYVAGAEHELFVIYKGFRDQTELDAARALLSSVQHTPIYTSDDTFDLGAYAEALPHIGQDRICFLNTNSEVRCEGWLGKLAVNLDQPRVGVVSATASFESLSSLDSRFPRFPNVHIRSNAFMLDREVAFALLSDLKISDKIDAYFAESGPNGFTRKIFEMGRMAVVVGCNGRGYHPTAWHLSETFRQGTQSNLLVHDNVTRAFENLPFHEKRAAAASAWGDQLQTASSLLLPA
jgi:hypothetical protein